MSSHGYGYQMWMGGREGSFNYNGMLGQDVLAYRDLNMVVVTNAGSKELFQNCVLLGIVKKYFEGDYNPPSRLPDDLRSQIMLQHVIEEMEGRRTSLPVIERCGKSGRLFTSVARCGRTESIIWTAKPMKWKKSMWALCR